MYSMPTVDFLFVAQSEVSFKTRSARITMSTVPSAPNPIADRKRSNTWPDRNDVANYFVPGDAGQAGGEYLILHDLISVVMS